MVPQREGMKNNQLLLWVAERQLYGDARYLEQYLWNLVQEFSLSKEVTTVIRGRVSQDHVFRVLPTKRTESKQNMGKMLNCVITSNHCSTVFKDIEQIVEIKKP